MFLRNFDVDYDDGDKGEDQEPVQCFTDWASAVFQALTV